MKQARFSEIAAFVGEDGCAITELVGKDAAIKNERFSVVRTVVPPGTKALRHYHTITEELYIVTSGTGRIVVDDKAIDVSAGDAVFIDIGEYHFAVSSADTELVFLAISLPAYDADDFIVDE